MKNEGKKDGLFFEAGDMSQLNTNGKQVFVAKRINGKTEKNKETKKTRKKNIKNENEKLAENEIIIELNKTPKTIKNSSKNEKAHTHNKAKHIKEKPNKKKKEKSKKQNKKNNKQNEKSKKKTTDKNHRKKNKKRDFTKLLIILIIIIGTLAFALISPIFNITTISVQGNNQIAENTIISLSGLKTGNNIFQFISSNIESNIKENPYINSVEIKRKLPGTVQITVEEREVAYQVQIIESYVYLDYQGYILETSSDEAETPIITGLETSQDDLLNGTRVINEDISKLNTILKIVENAKTVEIYDMITEIIIENGEYILYLEGEKKYIYLGDGSELTDKMLYVEAIIENEKGNSGKVIIDGNLSDGFNPYFSEEKID